ncbi:MAG: hypothetical protein C0618_00420 [Desulfuromonas sp.]|nr:MAG: hypothetical protein C0618_00420 [Desulfuromonas sp.]
MAERLKVRLLVLMALLLLPACAGRDAPDIVVVDSELATSVCRVVVVPFVDEAGDPGIGQLSSRIFSNELINSKQFTVIPEGEVRNFLRQKKMLIPDLMETRTKVYRQLGERLRVDAVIRGTIMNSGIDVSGREGSIPYLSIKVEMIDVKTGKLLIDTFHQRRGDEYRKIMHIGIVRTKTGLMARVAEEIISRWRTKGVANCLP